MCVDVLLLSKQATPLYLSREPLALLLKALRIFCSGAHFSEVFLDDVKGEVLLPRPLRYSSVF